MFALSFSLSLPKNGITTTKKTRHVEILTKEVSCCFAWCAHFGVKMIMMLKMCNDGMWCAAHPLTGGLDYSISMDSGASTNERARRYRNLVEVEKAGGLSQADKLSELLMVAKVRPALLASRAAYHEEDLFRERTGITKCRLVSEDKFDTQVGDVVFVCLAQVGSGNTV